MPVLNKYHHGNKVPDGAINIMRGTIYGNPFQMGVDGTREEVVEKFKHYLWDRIKKDPVFRQAVKELHEKDVCCCCHPKACHGDVLLAAAKWLVEREKSPKL